MHNPLLVEFDAPFGTAPFDQIQPTHYLPAINWEKQKLKK
jgi:peptidyl-dipeptidase Dcp